MDPTTIAFWRGQTNAQINNALNASLDGSAPLSPAALQAMLLSRSVEIGNARAALLYGNSVGGVPSWQLAEDLSTGSIRPDGTREIAVFSQTEMGQLRNSVLFGQAVTQAHLSDPAAIASFYGASSTPGLDDAMSRAYVSNLRVPVITITGPDSDPGRVFGRTEVPAILNNPNIPSVDGLSRTDLLQRFQGSNLVGRNGATDVFEMIKARSFDNMVQSGASIGFDASGNARFAPNADFLTRAGASNVTPRPNLPDVPNGTRSIGSLSDNALASLGRGARYLDFLGTAGDVLEGVLVFNTARELLQAGDAAGAAQAIAEWGGGLAGGALGVSLVAPLAAGLAATGVGAVGSVALLVAAGVVGSIAGEQAVRSLINNLDEIGAFFGEAYENVADFLVNGGNAAADFITGLVDYAADITDRVAAFGTELAFDAVDAVMDFLRDAGSTIADLGGDVASTLDSIGDALSDIGQSLGDLFSDAISWIDQAGNSFSDAIRDQLRRLIDPIVLDLDGNGIELTPRSTSNVYFDMDGDGIKELTGWVKPTDGLLAIDSNANGQIDNINELIGDLGRSGFAELITYDLNNDRLINNSDAVWQQLRVWVDSNSNGVTDSGELRTLDSFSIRSIDLRFTAVNFIAEGNQIHEQSIFEYTDGTTGLVADIWFDVSNVATDSAVTLTGNITIDDLPDIRGRGDVESLRSVMLVDGALTTLVSGFVAQDLSSLGNARAQAEQIIYRWSGVQSVNPASRGAFFDGRKLAALEAFLGTAFRVQGNSNPNAQAVASLTQSWESLVDGILARLLMSSAVGNAVADSAVYVPEIDRLLTIQTPTELFASFRAASPDGDGLVIASYWAATLPLVREIIQDVGGVTTGSAYESAIREALLGTGLAPFVNVLDDGILSAPPAAMQLGGTGVYRLTAGSDNLSVTGELMAVFGAGGNDVISISGTSTARRLLNGGDGNDQLQGGLGDDWLDGGAGADTMAGGAGNDIYTVDNVGDVVLELPGAGTDEVRSSISYVLGADFEHLTLLGDAALNGAGNATANRISGNSAANRLEGLAGDDTIDGGAGADTMVGGLGADTYFVDNSGDVIIETGSDIDTVHSSINYTLGARLENLFLTGTTLNGTGNALNNRLTGNDQNNVLNGGAGNDTMAGGLGDDTYVVDSAGDVVNEAAGAGVDMVQASVNYTLAAHLENLTLIGSLDINGTGNSVDNRLIGNSGDNVLNGGAGNDRMEGGAGDDVYIVDAAGDVVIEAANRGTDTVRTTLAIYTLGANVENLQLFITQDTVARNGTGNDLTNVMTGNNGANVLSGLNGDDQLFGNGGNDTLLGGAGNDLLDGGAGDDRMEGGIGDDTYVINSVGDVVVEVENGGTDTVQSSVSFILSPHLEHLILSGSANIDGQGNAANNQLTGNTGNNNLDGGAGADTMAGGAGNDIYTVDNVGDVVLELPGAGTDEVRSSISYVLGLNIENLTMLGSANLSGVGNAENNVIDGNSGGNRIVGGFGRDVLTGNAGPDTFVFQWLDETGNTQDTADLITDFQPAQGDSIDLSGIDADSLTMADDSFSFIGNSAFTATGQARFTITNGVTYVSLNTDANFITIEAMIALRGNVSLNSEHFFL